MVSSPRNSGGFCSKAASAIFEYQTLKVVKIENKKVGFVFRLIQLLIIGYVIGYAIIWKKGYQEFDEPISSVTSKLKGTALVNFTTFKSSLLHGMYIFDPADYVVPPQENNAFFVMTNMIITPNQTRSTCPEDPKFKTVHCDKDADCPQGEAVVNGNGVRTGRCVDSDRVNIKVCEIYAWCPVEVDELPMPGHNFSLTVPLLDAARNFTVLIKNTVSFRKFGFLRRNIVNQNRSSYLKHCHYNSGNDKLCPIFTIESLTNGAGVNFNELSYEGGNIAIVITWDCNLDLSDDECVPIYSFKRLDDPNAPIAKGYNFRFPQYYVEDGHQHRILYKAYGIKVDVLVKGKAGKFSIVPLFLNLGSGFALLGIATVFGDILVIYILKSRQKYRESKFQTVEESDVDSDTDDSVRPVTTGREYQQLKP